MPCFHPLKGFVVGTTKNGKRKFKVVSYDVESIPNMYISSPTDPAEYTDFVPIPCGRCIGCRLEYSRQWAMRCMLETTYHDQNWFITLTYDDEHVPKCEYPDKETGELLIGNTLYKRHVQLFNKALRQKLFRDGKPGYRYYACGEYGSKTARPHYHMIAFGLHLDDLKVHTRNKHGFTLYTSQTLTDVWGRGHVIIGNVSFESCAYVSRYIMKKQKGDAASFYDDYNLEPEFTIMSRKPGIDKQYFEDNVSNIYPSDKIILPDGRASKPPRYFDKLMDELDEELMQNVKDVRIDVAERLQGYKSELTTADYIQSLEHAENNQLAKIKKLVRHRDI